MLLKVRKTRKVDLSVGHVVMIDEERTHFVRDYSLGSRTE